MMSAFLKVVAVGEPECGKSCLMSSFRSNKSILGLSPYNLFYSKGYVEADFDMVHVNYFLHNTSRMENQEPLRKFIYENPDVFLLCFSVVNFESFQMALTKWYLEIRQCYPKVPIVMVGNKLDLRSKIKNIEGSGGIMREPVQKREALEMGKKPGIYKYVECSAKLYVGVRDVFETAFWATCDSSFTIK